jgi:acyl-CoA synthetase (AMP-forming)/AMP-acid ligase II
MALGVQTLGDIARRNAAENPQGIALVFEGRQTTFLAFDQHTNQVANALAEAGVKPGDRVAYFGKNSDHYFELLLGAAKAGAVMTPIGWRLAPPEVAHVLNDSRAPILFVGPEGIDCIRALASGLTSLKTIIAMEGGADGWESYADWRDRQSMEDPRISIKSSDVVLQLYTSGTTGRPKGAMLTHANFLEMRAHAEASDDEWLKWQPDDISLIAMPIAHIGGTGYGIWTFYYGVKGIVAREFDPGKILDFIEHERANKFFMVPAALQLVIRDPRARHVDFSRIRHIFYGASPIPLQLLRECIEVFGCGFVQMYGLTETTGTIVALGPEDHTLEGSPKMRSAGKVLNGVELKILDAAGTELAVGEVGEIAVRSPANMAGYWNLPEATAAVVVGDNWLRTGDAGYIDAEGYVYVHDRVKDMIVSGAENIYPAEVENAIYGHPDVAEVAVIGIPSEKWGEEVKAVVAPKPGTTPDPADIIRWARERIAGFKVPKTVDFVAALPRNASGKILRRELRKPYWEGRDRQVN